jgi:hypothetical protein
MKEKYFGKTEWFKCKLFQLITFFVGTYEDDLFNYYNLVWYYQLFFYISLPGLSH